MLSVVFSDPTSKSAINILSKAKTLRQMDLSTQSPTTRLQEQVAPQLCPVCAFKEPVGMLGILAYAIGALGSLKDLAINLRDLEPHFAKANLSFDDYNIWTHHH